jgi:hypothetical protein
MSCPSKQRPETTEKKSPKGENEEVELELGEKSVQIFGSQSYRIVGTGLFAGIGLCNPHSPFHK